MFLAGEARSRQNSAMFFAARSSPVLSAFGLFLLTSVPCTAEEKLGHLRGVFRASFNHDASRVLARTREGTVSIWELPAGTTRPRDLETKAGSAGVFRTPD